MQITKFIEKLNNGNFDKVIAELYPNKPLENRKARILDLANKFLADFGDLDASLFSAPGRTELSGNHTDHNNGCALAGSLDIDVIAFAAKTDDNTVHVKSAGFRDSIVDISNPTPAQERQGSSSSTIAGLAAYFRDHGYKAGGFVAHSTSDVLTGSGLSSSAAFEILCASIFSEFYNDNSIPAMELAKAGKYAENVYFGKPCGLLDQAASASGGCVWLDFENEAETKAEKMDFDISKYGYNLCIVNTGGSHADLTDDYAAVPAEMHSVAQLMGKQRLRQCDESDFVSRISYMRSILGDRAILRAIHFFAENKRVEAQKNALKNNDIDTFLKLVTESGNSSYKFLQNVYASSNPSEQGISLALAITEGFGAVCRVHGGGFAGTIQAYVKSDRVADYKATIEAVFGEDSCLVCSIRPYGAAIIEEDKIRG